MTGVHEVLQRILESKAYADWSETSKEKSFLFSIFMMREGQWEVVFYNPETKKATSWSDDGEHITLVGKDMDMVLNEKTTPSLLNMDEVKIERDEAVNTAEKEVEKNRLVSIARFCVLQTVGTHPSWIVTFSTESLKIIRVMINATTGTLSGTVVQDLTSMIRKG